MYMGGTGVKIKLETRIEAAERAFDMLGTDGPRVAHNALRELAYKQAAENASRAHGALASLMRVRDYSEGDITVFLIAPDDISYYGQDKDGDNRRVAVWTNHGTRTGIQAQKWFRRVPKTKQKGAVADAINRAARRAGFTVFGG